MKDLGDLHEPQIGRTKGFSDMRGVTHQLQLWTVMPSMSHPLVPAPIVDTQRAGLTPPLGLPQNQQKLCLIIQFAWDGCCISKHAGPTTY